ncbi:mannonate dehydratase, partial [Ruminococcus bicirculans]
MVFKDLESINVHEDIKLGLPSRDQYIENYITSLRNAAKAGIEMGCYNFMPVFDWTRTELAKPL